MKSLSKHITESIEINESSMQSEKFENVYADDDFESYVSKNYEICRIDKNYYISDIDENELQIDDRKSLRQISKKDFDKAIIQNKK